MMRGGAHRFSETSDPLKAPDHLNVRSVFTHDGFARCRFGPVANTDAGALVEVLRTRTGWKTDSGLDQFHYVGKLCHDRLSQAKPITDPISTRQP